jgi:hypothetical protein
MNSSNGCLGDPRDIGRRPLPLAIHIVFNRLRITNKTSESLIFIIIMYHLELIPESYEIGTLQCKLLGTSSLINQGSLHVVYYGPISASSNTTKTTSTPPRESLSSSRVTYPFNGVWPDRHRYLPPPSHFSITFSPTYTFHAPLTFFPPWYPEGTPSLPDKLEVTI